MPEGKLGGTNVHRLITRKTNEKRTLEKLQFMTSHSGSYMRFLHEPGNGFRSSFHMKFLKDIGQVVFHRFVAQAELDGNLLIGFSFSQEGQD